MRRRAPLFALSAVLVACGGTIQPYWSDDDAGNCVEHASRQYCHFLSGPCDDGGPPDSSGNPASSPQQEAIVTCTP